MAQKTNFTTKRKGPRASFSSLLDQGRNDVKALKEMLEIMFPEGEPKKVAKHNAAFIEFNYIYITLSTKYLIFSVDHPNSTYVYCNIVEELGDPDSLDPEMFYKHYKECVLSIIKDKMKFRGRELELKWKDPPSADI